MPFRRPVCGAANAQPITVPDRTLTTSERALLPPPLALATGLNDVRIVARWHTPVAALLKVTVVRGARIFWANAPADAITLSEQAHLAHELVHVWQYKALKRTGVELLLSRLYRYRLDPRRAFISYGCEQQAAIVEDYVRVSAGSPPRWSAMGAPDREDYAAVIASASGAAG